MSFWDPYDPYGRERRRRLAEERRRAELEAARRAHAEQEAARRRALAEQQAARPPAMPPELIQRFERELAEARRERDEWADRYQQALKAIEGQRQALAEAREQLEAETAGLREQARAEAEAQRERVLRNAEQRAFEENRRALAALLPVADNLERALEQVGAADTALAEGVRLTLRDFRRVLEGVGVERLASVGQPFDPALHEAVATRPAEGDEGTILDEISPGYRYRGALLRPARVVIVGQ